jgi:hypothetical protein
MAEETYVKKVCVSCKTSDTPLWRLGPQGPKTMCNACGIKWKRKIKNGSIGGGSPKKRKRPDSSTKEKKAKISRAKPVSSSSDSETVSSLGPTSSDDEESVLSPVPISSPGEASHDSEENPISTEEKDPNVERTITMADFSIEVGIGRSSLRTRNSLRTSSPDDLPALKSKQARKQEPASPVKKKKTSIAKKKTPHEKSPPKPLLPSEETSSVPTHPVEDQFSISFHFPAAELRSKRCFFDIASFELERLEEEMKYNQEVSHFKEEVQILKDQLHQRDVVLANLLTYLSEAATETVSKTTLLQQLPSEIVTQTSKTSLDPDFDTL